MGTERIRPVFICLVLVAAAFLAALELSLARGANVSATADSQWRAPQEATDRAITPGEQGL